MQFLISLIVTVTLMEMMFSMGLRLNFIHLANSILHSQGLVMRAVIVNYAIIPVLTLFVIWLFKVPAMVATGLLILAVCPAAPYGPPFTAIAKGNLTLSIGLMVILAGSSAIMAPLLLHVLIPLVAGSDQSIQIDAVKLLGSLFMIQLLPLCLGLAVGQWRPGIAGKLVTPASHISKALNLLMVVVIGTVQFNLLDKIDTNVLTAMLLLVSTSMITGWITGWPGKENRKAMSIVTALRNMSLGMVIAAGSFPGSPVLTTVLIYAFVAGLGLLLTSLWWRFAETTCSRSGMRNP